MSKIVNIINTLAESLEISEKTFESANKRYVSLGQWLNRDDSKIKMYAPEVYSQGSIRLGTAIKPINPDDDYDLDAVCLLNNINQKIYTQKNVKELVGYEVKKYVTANNFNKEADEGKRCWTIEYADSTQFHLDILPAIPDKIGMNEKFDLYNISMDKRAFVDHAISITDNTHEQYEYISSNWFKSNPKGYYEWFLIRQKITKYKNRGYDGLMIANEAVEDIPISDITTPLQQSIMILKRHRDIMFNNPSINKYKPISIIITTIAAHAYSGEDNLYDALVTIVNNMKVDIVGNRYSLSNPVNPLENFADKWEDEPLLRSYFLQWLEQIKSDFNTIINEDINSSKKTFKTMFGNELADRCCEINGVKDNIIISTAKRLLGLSHIKTPTWERNIQGGLTIKCSMNQNGFQHKYIKSNQSIPKNVSLRFEVNLSKDLKRRKREIKYRWQVANSGLEASNANCLRGDFYEGILEKGGKIREEQTSYSGEHFVKCFAILNKKIIAESTPFIVNIQG